MRALTTLALLSLLGCRRADADPQPAARAALPRVGWRDVAPGIRFAETTDTFADIDGRAVPSAWVVARIDLARAALTIVRSPNDRPDGVMPLGDVALAFNAGFFNPDLNPTGLIVRGGALVSPATFAGGSGAVAIAAGRARLLNRERFLDGGVAWDGASLVVQCNPRLIEADGSIGIHRDDGHRFARTAACIRDRGRTLDLVATWQTDVPLRGPSLYEFARRLAGPTPTGDPGCEAALNLDGGPSTGFFVRAGAWRYVHDPVGPAPWLLVARR